MVNLNPQVTVIIPTYNRKHYLQQALESVLSQTYQNYELIIVDDASSDGTSDWLEATYPSIHLVRLLENRGAAGARNEGIRLASGQFIAFLDSDDGWLPTYLETQVKTLQENPQAVLSFCNYIEIREKPIQTYTVSTKPLSIYSDLTHHLLMRTFIPTMSIVMVRYQTLVQTDLLNEGLKICHDRNLYLQLLYLGEFIHIPQALVKRVLHSSNVVGNSRLMSKEVLKIIDLFFEDERSEPYRHLEAEAKSQWCLNIARLVWKENKDFFLAIQMIGKSFWFSPSLIPQTICKKITKNSRRKVNS